MVSHTVLISTHEVATSAECSGVVWERAALRHHTFYLVCTVDAATV